MGSGVDGSGAGRSNPAVRRGSRSTDSRRFDRRRGDGDSSLPAVKSTREETLRAVLRAKGYSREAAHMMSRSLRDSSLQVSSFQHLYDTSVQRRTSPSDDNFTSHVCGFCVTSLGLWSCSRSAHQATHQSFQAGTSGATQNYAQVGPSSFAFIFIETDVHIRVQYSRGILWRRHSLKMADHENCVPASIGFGETARIECLGRQVCVLERSHPATTCGISFARTWFPCEESTTVTGSGVDHRTGIAHLNPSEVERILCPVRQLKLFIRWTRKESWGAVNGCLFIGIATSRISWEVTSADGSWRLSKKPTLKLIKSMIELLHMRSEHCQHHGRTTVRWPYLTSCQLRFGGHLGSSRIRIYGTWLVSLMACLLWVQWWSHSKLWIQDIFTLLHSLHDLYAATATTFLMKITWFLAGIFIYGME